MIYLDNSATTKPCETAIKNINRCLCENWGNPSALYSFGIDAEEELTNARKVAAKSIGASDDEIYFTSGGSEANNTAVFGVANAMKKRGNRIVVSAIEHPSVLLACESLESLGFEIIKLHPDSNGFVPAQTFFDAINQNTILVSIMLVNNEIGSVQDVLTAREAIEKANSPALLHCDAVQAYGKMNINVKKLKVDLLSVSGHKIHGPKGIGFLYKAKGKNVSPLILGGGQEKGFRSGTESLPLISGLKGAIQELPDLSKQAELQKELWNYAKEKLLSLENVTVNSSDNCLPYILNVSILGYKSETLLHYLEDRDIFVSSGSACSKGHKSYVLSECGLNDKQIDSALRISFSRYNTKEDIDCLVDAISSARKVLRRSNI